MATRRELRGLNAYHSKAAVIISGADELSALLSRLDKKHKERIRDEVMRPKAEWIVRKAKPLTPDDPETQGALRDSVRVWGVLARRNDITAIVVVGGKPLAERLKGHSYWAWALVQHEDTTLRHPHGGQAKFLEQPVLEVAPTIPAAVIALLDDIASNG